MKNNTVGPLIHSRYPFPLCGEYTDEANKCSRLKNWNRSKKIKDMELSIKETDQKHI